MYSNITARGVVAKARKEVEIAVRVGNRPAALGEALAAIAARGVKCIGVLQLL